MHQKGWAFLSVSLGLLWCVLTVSVFAQGGAPATQPTPDAGVPIIYRGQEIVRVYRGMGGIGPAERARLASERLNQFVRDPSFDPTRVTVTHLETVSELVYDDRVLGVITDEDAQVAGRPRPEFAQQVRDRLVEVVASTREEFTVGSIAIGLGWAALATAILAALLWLLARLGPRVHVTGRRVVPKADGGSQSGASRRGSGNAPKPEGAQRRRRRDRGRDRCARGGVAAGGASATPLEPALRAAGLPLSVGAGQDALARLVRLRAEPLLHCRHRSSPPSWC